MEPIYVKSRWTHKKIGSQGRDAAKNAQTAKCEALKEGFRTSRRLRRRPKSFARSHRELARAELRLHVFGILEQIVPCTYENFSSTCRTIFATRARIPLHG